MKNLEIYSVYIHICPNNKKYVGVTTNIKRRWSRNGSNYYQNTKFTEDIKKYGWDCIRHKVVHECLSRTEAFNKEIELISKYKTNNPIYGYNRTSGGIYGTILNEESKLKIILANKGKFVSESTRQKLRDLRLGINLSDVTRKKISESHKGKKHTLETKQKITESLTGKTLSEKTKSKLSAINTGKVKSELCKKKISESLTGKNHSYETRLKMSESQKRRRANETNTIRNYTKTVA